MMPRTFGRSTVAGCLLLLASAQCFAGEVRLRRNVLEFTGEITADDPAKIRKLLNVDPKFTSDVGQAIGPMGDDYFAALERAKKVKRFRINSPGGNYLTAVELGIIIQRAGGLEYMTVELPAGSTCIAPTVSSQTERRRKSRRVL